MIQINEVCLNRRYIHNEEAKMKLNVKLDKFYGSNLARPCVYIRGAFFFIFHYQLYFKKTLKSSASCDINDIVVFALKTVTLATWFLFYRVIRYYHTLLYHVGLFEFPLFTNLNYWSCRRFIVTHFSSRSYVIEQIT